MNSFWYVYLVEAKNGNLYTGITTDLERRMKQHQGDVPGGSKFMKSKGFRELRWVFACRGRSLASRYEAALKKYSRKEKMELIRRNLSDTFRQTLQELASKDLEIQTEH